MSAERIKELTDEIRAISDDKRVLANLDKIEKLAGTPECRSIHSGLLGKRSPKKG